MNEVKVGKLPVKTTQRTCDFISKLGKKKNNWGQKYGGFWLNSTKIPLIVFQLEDCEQISEKGNKVLHIVNEEMGAATFDSQQLKI